MARHSAKDILNHLTVVGGTGLDPCRLDQPEASVECSVKEKEIQRNAALLAKRDAYIASLKAAPTYPTHGLLIPWIQTLRDPYF